jgi:hypothetical protein
MKVICFECNKEVGEKAPFSDTEATHTLCASCLSNTLKRLRAKRGRQREQPRGYSVDVSLKPEG